MQLPPSVRLTTYLNALINNLVSVEVAAVAITAADVAHHVTDPDGVLGLNALRASDLETALSALVPAERDGWLLTLPAPGSLGSLRGPAEFNTAALTSGEAVIAGQGSIGLVPHRVGQAVQWRLFGANRPIAAPSPYEAERALAEATLAAARALANLDVASGTRPRMEIGDDLAPGYGSRQRATADRALRLITACDLALADDGGAISSFEIDVRNRELRKVRDAATQALCAACSWIDR